jgi:hypothetical protein
MRPKTNLDVPIFSIENYYNLKKAINVQNNKKCSSNNNVAQNEDVPIFNIENCYNREKAINVQYSKTFS